MKITYEIFWICWLIVLIVQMNRLVKVLNKIAKELGKPIRIIRKEKIK